MMSVPAGLPRPAFSTLQLVCIKYASRKRVAATAFRKKEPENAGRLLEFRVCWMGALVRHPNVSIQKL